MIKAPKGSLGYSISALFGKSIISILEFIIARFEPKQDIFETSEFDWVIEVESFYPDILMEYNNIKNKNLLSDIRKISLEQESVVSEDKWFFFPLYIYGFPIEKNLKQCPKTFQALNKIPNITTVFFSTLSPQTYIKQHRGAYKGYLRYHLGIVIPKDESISQNCRIRIKEKEYRWEEGKSLIFDDTYLHDAWNYTNNNRVVLYIDFIRPMPEWLVTISKFLTRLICNSPFIQNGLKLYENEGSKSISSYIK